jgi:hypothetical protein
VPNSNTPTVNRGTGKMERKLAAALLARPLHRVLDAGPKLSRWYERLCWYKKRGLAYGGV